MSNPPAFHVLPAVRLLSAGVDRLPRGSRGEASVLPKLGDRSFGPSDEPRDRLHDGRPHVAGPRGSPLKRAADRLCPPGPCRSERVPPFALVWSML